MSGALAAVTADSPVTSSGREVAVASRIRPTNEADMPVFSAMMSPLRERCQPAKPMTTRHNNNSSHKIMMRSFAMALKPA